MDGHACYNAPLPVNIGNDQSQCNIDGPSKYVAPAEVASNPNPQQKTPSVLFIGDSISANIDVKLLAHSTKTEFKQVRAYSSIHDTISNEWKMPAKFPNSNFTSVVPAELQKGTFQSLVLQAPSVDITNLKTNVNPSKYIKKWEQQTILSAKNFFSVVENALKTKPTLNKVVILKLIPRYDPPSVDPLGLKSDLSKKFNAKLEELCRQSTFKSKVFVGSHNIACTGALRESRYLFIEFYNSHSLFIAGTGTQKQANLMGSICSGMPGKRLTL